jgi:hypothetical protein
MRQKTTTPQTSFEPLGWQKPGNGRRLAWLGVELCSSFLHRWFNVYEIGAEDALYALPGLRRFAGVNLGSIAAPCETVSLHARRLLERHDFSRPVNSQAFSGSPLESGISWRTPWLYLPFLLLVLLLLF